MSAVQQQLSDSRSCPAEYPADHRGPEQRGRGEVDGVLWRSKIFLLTPDPNADPFCAKPPWSGESTTSGFCPFQSQKWPKSAVPQRMEKSTAAHNPEVGGSSPPPATRNPLESPDSSGLFLFSATFLRGLFLAFKSDPDSDPYGNFSGLDGAINCRRGRVPWPPPPAAGPRWSHGRRCPG